MNMASSPLIPGVHTGRVVEAASRCGTSEPVNELGPGLDSAPIPIAPEERGARRATCTLMPRSPRASGGSRAIEASSEGRPVDTVITAVGPSATRGCSDRRGFCAPAPGWAPGVFRGTR
jgi:hypothetical protein